MNGLADAVISMPGGPFFLLEPWQSGGDVCWQLLDSREWIRSTRGGWKLHWVKDHDSAFQREVWLLFCDTAAGNCVVSTLRVSVRAGVFSLMLGGRFLLVTTSHAGGGDEVNVDAQGPIRYGDRPHTEFDAPSAERCSSPHPPSTIAYLNTPSCSVCLRNACDKLVRWFVV